jgi:hypothetical protein
MITDAKPIIHCKINSRTRLEVLLMLKIFDKNPKQFSLNLEKLSKKTKLEPYAEQIFNLFLKVSL